MICCRFLDSLGFIGLNKSPSRIGTNSAVKSTPREISARLFPNYPAKYEEIFTYCISTLGFCCSRDMKATSLKRQKCKK